MSEAVEVAVISAALALAGVLVTMIGSLIANRRDMASKRLELMFTVNQELVDNLREERTELHTRLEALERDHQAQAAQMTQMRDAVQALRLREAELRGWAAEIMSWAAVAVSIIRGMSGTIEDPPVPPREHDTVGN